MVDQPPQGMQSPGGARAGEKSVESAVKAGIRRGSIVRGSSRDGRTRPKVRLTGVSEKVQSWEDRAEMAGLGQKCV